MQLAQSGCFVAQENPQGTELDVEAVLWQQRRPLPLLRLQRIVLCVNLPPLLSAASEFPSSSR
jgi:hypothetical protein